jgi:glycolate oxidase
MELIDEYSSKLTAEFLQTASTDLSSSDKPQLIVSFDGNDPGLLERSLEKCYHLIQEYSSEEVFVAKSDGEKKKIWLTRMNIGQALTQGNKVYRDIDMAIPVSGLYDYIIEVKRISKLFDVQIACFGHVGNGNLHTMVALENLEDLGNTQTSKAIEAIYQLGIGLGGTISGEHGVGLLQKEFMRHQFSSAHLKLLTDIKRVFDPKNLINPGKIIN